MQSQEQFKQELAALKGQMNEMLERQETELSDLDEKHMTERADLKEKHRTDLKDVRADIQRYEKALRVLEPNESLSDEAARILAEMRTQGILDGDEKTARALVREQLEKAERSLRGFSRAWEHAWKCVQSKQTPAHPGT